MATRAAPTRTPSRQWSSPRIPVVSPTTPRRRWEPSSRKSGRTAIWIIPLTREKASGYVAEMLLSMLEALWVGQSDRHGGNLPPIPVTTEAAQAAVLMATTLFSGSSRVLCGAARSDARAGHHVAAGPGRLVLPRAVRVPDISSLASDGSATNESIRSIGVHMARADKGLTTPSVRRPQQDSNLRHKV